MTLWRNHTATFSRLSINFNEMVIEVPFSGEQHHQILWVILTAGESLLGWFACIKA